MLRLDPFHLETPNTVDEAVALLARHGDKAKILAGGTDVLPNMKHGLHEPEVVISIGRLSALKGIRETAAGLQIGALTTLHDIENSPLVHQAAPSLARAASLVAGPQLRRMGTLGGNICLDTRCLYYNQTHFWRESLGFCLKKDGTVCHVVAGGKKCVAAASNDTATMLLCLDATVDIQSSVPGRAGTRTVALDDFFVGNGIKNTILEPGDLLVRIAVPRAPATTRVAGYAKLRHRNSIDFPLLSVGVRVDLDAAGLIAEARLVVSALGARPNRVNVDAWKGKALNDQTIEEMAALAFARCTPLTNIADDPAWRKDMVPVYVKRAFDDARGRSHAA